MRATTRAALALVGLLAACSTSTVTPPPAPTPAVVPAPAAVVVPAPRAMTRESTATSIDAYKREVAEMLLKANADQVFRGRPPEMLYGVVVLQFNVAPDGSVSKISLLRVPPHAPELGPQAVNAIERAAPLLRPNAALAHGQSVAVTESLLFRDDRKFAVRSLALPQ